MWVLDVVDYVVVGGHAGGGRGSKETQGNHYEGHQCKEQLESPRRNGDLHRNATYHSLDRHGEVVGWRNVDDYRDICGGRGARIPSPTVAEITVPLSAEPTRGTKSAETRLEAPDTTL